MMALNPSAPKIKVFTSDEQVVEIPQKLAVQSSLIKNMLSDLGEPDAPIPLPNVTAKNLFLILPLVTEINNEPDQEKLKREDGKYIAQLIQPVISQALAKMNDQDLAQMIYAAEYLDFEAIVNGAIRVMVEKALSQNPKTTIDSIIGKFFSTTTLPQRAKDIITYQYQLVSNNNIRELSVADYIAINGMPKIQKSIFGTYNLSLSNKKLTSLEGIDQITSYTIIEYIDVSKNKLTTLPGNTFRGLSALKNINLSKNQLYDLYPTLFKNLTNLKVINLAENKLETLPEELLSNLTQLTGLYLSQNSLKTLPDQIFKDLNSLTNLNLSKNLLNSLPTHIFDHLINLRDLNLSDNKFASLQDGLFDNLIKLQGLEIGGNQLITLPAAIFSKLESLLSILLNENRLQNLPATLFHNLTTLESIHINDNALEQLPSDIFNGLTNLITLGIKENPGFSRTSREALKAQFNLPADIEIM